MKAILAIIILGLSAFSHGQIPRNDSLELNYNLIYRDAITLKFNSKLSQDQNWDFKGFNSGVAWSLSRGSSRFSVAYEAHRMPMGNFDVSSRYGIMYSNSGPNTALNISLYNYDNFTNISGITGKIDINVKFK